MQYNPAVTIQMLHSVKQYNGCCHRNPVLVQEIQKTQLESHNINSDHVFFEDFLNNHCSPGQLCKPGNLAVADFKTRYDFLLSSPCEETRATEGVSERGRKGQGSVT